MFSASRILFTEGRRHLNRDCSGNIYTITKGGIGAETTTTWAETGLGATEMAETGVETIGIDSRVGFRIKIRRASSSGGI